jgi:cytochrome c-type biogenesis protein CcmE
MEDSPATVPGPDQRSPAPGKRRAKFLVGGAVIALAIIGLIVFAMTRPGSTSFYMTPTELQASGASQPGGDIKVNGDLVQKSVEEEGVNTTFDITDGDSFVTVTTDTTLPDAFYSDSDEIEIIAQGRYDGNSFTATQVFAKCPSKFKARA